MSEADLVEELRSLFERVIALPPTEAERILYAMAMTLDSTRPVDGRRCPRCGMPIAHHEEP